MSKKVWLVILVALALVVALSACTKSASNAPVTTPTATGNFPFPTPIPDDALKNIQAGTQTAVAAMTQPAGATPAAPQGATATPAAVAVAATQTPVPVIPTATKPAVVFPTATPGHPASYTLQKGEFPFCIARRYNLSIASLLSLNGLNINSKPAVGTVLNLPANSSWDAGSRSLIAHPATYTVVSGDTIYSIACAYGDADPNAIITANSLKSPYDLTAGQVLQIP
jgi:LysM repeat protein